MSSWGRAWARSPRFASVPPSANVTVSGDIATFTMATGEGAKIKPGHILSSLGETDTAKQYSFYVLSVSTDTVTAKNGWLGSTIANASADLNNAILEQNPAATEAAIHKRVATVFARYLWPEAYIHRYWHHCHAEPFDLPGRAARHGGEADWGRSRSLLARCSTSLLV